MKIRKLSELGTFKNGLNFSKEDAAGEGCKMIGVGDFGDRTYPDVASLSEINKELVSKNELLADGDILFVRSNGNKALVGRSMYIKSLDEDVCYSGFCIRFRPDQTQVDPTYLFYALRSPYCRKQYTPSQQTNITNLSQDVLGDVMVPVFDEIADEVQYATLLDAIDSKIDMNQQICATMESMAKTLYDYWFVQFDFPDANGKPYRASGGEMVWNDQLKLEIPKGWELGTVSTLMTIDNISVDPRKLGTTVMEHYSIPAFDEGGLPAFEAADTIESGKYAVNAECILTSKLNPHFKRLWDPFCETDNAICSTEFIVYRPRNIWKRPYCYSILNSDAFYTHMVSNAIASTGSRKRIQPDVSAAFKLAIAPDETITAFNAIYAPIMEKLKSLRRENRELSQLRDWLLPMLMNGQATVAPAKPAPKLQVLQPEKPARDPRFDRWLQTQGVAARGTVNEQTLHDIFDAMDDDDKQ